MLGRGQRERQRSFLGPSSHSGALVAEPSPERVERRAGEQPLRTEGSDLRRAEVLETRCGRGAQTGRALGPSGPREQLSSRSPWSREAAPLMPPSGPRSPTPPAAAHLQHCCAFARAHKAAACPPEPRHMVTEAMACGLPMLPPVLPAPSRAGGKGTGGHRIRGIKCRQLLRHLVCVCRRPGCPRAPARGLSSDTPSGSCPHPAPAVAGPQWLLAWARRRDVTWGRSGNVPATCG